MLTNSKKQEYIRIRVSAKHLMLASPVLKKTLSGGWKESALFAKKGSIDLVVQGWDLEAFLLFLRIIHCQHKDLPSTITVEMLAKIAVLADYYACKDSVHFFANLWIEKLKAQFPSQYCRDSMLWLFISWFFGHPDELTKSTSITMTYSNAPIANLGLPIPMSVLGKILRSLFSARSFGDDFRLATLNQRREGWIKSILDRLKEERKRLLTKDWSCSFECCSMLLGALDRQTHLNGLSFPEPKAPYLGLNFHKLALTVNAFIIPEWAPTFSSYGHEHICEATTRGYGGDFETVVVGFHKI